MTTSEWLRTKIGPSPSPPEPDRTAGRPDPATAFFTRYLKPEMRLLHAYARSGRSSHALASHVSMGQVTGIDPDRESVRRARELAGPAEGPDVVFERSGIGATPFGSDSFDAVFIDGVFSTEGSPERAFEEVKRVLVPGGLLGVRHTTASSRVLSAEDPLLESGMERRDIAWQDRGGDPDAGLRQIQWLRDAGLVNVRVSSSTQQRLGDQLTAELSAGGFISDEPPADPDDEHPPVVVFTTVIQTVCWKAV